MRQFTPTPDAPPLAKALAAVMNPVTIAAIIVLLFNDAVFKQAWPGSWWTGKLSDLAWMVFAPPALAVGLALVAWGSRRWNRAVFPLAYVGLALVYLAYNLVEPLHDAIMGAFGLLTNAPATSPFDPTDAIVIPPAIAVAAWVWRHARPANLHRHAAFAVVAISMLASVATSREAAPIGITDISEDHGTITALSCLEGGSLVEVFKSVDGGRTFFPSAVSGDGTCRYRPSRFVEGTTPPEMDKLFDHRVQALTLRQAQNWLPPQAFRHGAYAWVEDPETGTLVVAMGVYGVAVKTQNGEWLWADVGPYHITDTSTLNRLLLLANAWVLVPLGFLAPLGGVWPLYVRRRAQITPEPVSISRSHTQLIILTGFSVAAFSALPSPAPEIKEELAFDFISMLGLVFALFVAGVIFPMAIATSDLLSTAWANRKRVLTTTLASFVALLVPLALWTQGAIATFDIARIAALAAVMVIVVIARWVSRGSPPVVRASPPDAPPPPRP